MKFIIKHADQVHGKVWKPSQFNVKMLLLKQTNNLFVKLFA